ncbi:amidase [Carex littledalei]|uniref:Amidase n=1 Tax=Carex littledalei TaxID=544730 RepID=A0A833QWC7_9POAL|nr:amidase [Carex littledalei]
MASNSRMQPLYPAKRPSTKALSPLASRQLTGELYIPNPNAKPITVSLHQYTSWHTSNVSVGMKDQHILAGARNIEITVVLYTFTCNRHYLKDNVATKHKLNTTSGSFAPVGSVAPCDAGVVQILRDAGAVILGKASMSEWYNFRAKGIPSGCSARGGQGEETDGSIICPSSFNSVVGTKPTIGLTSWTGVVIISPHIEIWWVDTYNPPYLLVMLTIAVCLSVSPVRSLQDVIDYNNNHPIEEKQLDVVVILIMYHLAYALVDWRVLIFEPGLIEIAFAFDQATSAREKPNSGIRLFEDDLIPGI